MHTSVHTLGGHVVVVCSERVVLVLVVTGGLPLLTLNRVFVEVIGVTKQLANSYTAYCAYNKDVGMIYKFT